MLKREVTTIGKVYRLLRFYDRKEDEKIEERGQYAAQYLDRVNLASLSGTRQNLDRARYTAGPCCPLGSQSE